MLKNYLKIAFRNLRNNKIYSTINILGLSLGIAASVLIVVFIADELSYDKFHPQSENQYRVDFTGKLNGNEFNMAMTGAPIGPAMAEEIPEVESTLRVGQWESLPIQYEELTFTEGKVLVVEKNFFDFFGFELLQGDPATVLDGPNKVVISEDNAKKYFGEEDPIGKVLLRGSGKTATEVSGVISNPPSNSHLTYDMIISGDSWEYMKNENWSSNNLYTYFRTYPEVDMSNVQAGLDGFIEKYFGPEIEQYLGFSMDELRAQGNNVGYGFMPVEDIHLYSELSEEPTTPGSIQYLYIFGAISIFIILIACINFMNLATAKSANRAKEVGVRKTIGASRIPLIGQFLAESMIYSFLSGLVALVFILIALQPFNALSGKDLSWLVFLDPVLLLAFFAFLFIVGLLAGSYPAFYLTSFAPSEVLKGKVRKGAKRSGFRNGLVVFQFFVSISLIISSLVVYKQLTYMQEVNLGFDKENVINLLHTRSLGNNAEAFKQELLSNTGFKAASYANNLPPAIDWTSVYRAVDTEQDFLFTMNWVDKDHLDAMGYEMVEGRFFSEEFPSDSTALIVNESAFKQIGWTELDGTQKISGYFNADENEVREVIGVIKDFNYDNLKLKIEPLIMGIEPEYFQEMAIRLNPGDIADRIEIIEELWRKYADGAAFEYSFVDSNFDSLYRSEKNMGNIILVFTVLAISIACLGLFGLAAFTTEQRAKEISIRKALGASMPNLITLLSKDFTLLVLVAFIIAGPLAYYVMDTYWLQNFAFKTSIGWALILGSGVMAVVIAWLTVSYQSFKTAASNPVDHLKSE
ncbi:ABC transporter permease [Algoriphagus sediminis]|uniref:ABC transporter permease n=1 Tax=Algoriphagus sediminis TaxID=3057113 RepID=A0ABT7Y9W9_9BACT|nr:ABC transporter permease [Algoriphagus sediminis]MDN3203317.1 ABC transporter permease [Algoriphagus sediminis]